MAKQMDWEKIFTATKPVVKEPKEKPTYDPAKQAEGYKKRIAGAGLDPEKAADTRNVVERLLNLRPDQNVLFDVFEIFNRPQQAIFGAVQAAQTGQDPLKGAIEGISGERYTRFKEILQNTNLKYTLPDRTEGNAFETIDAIDILGFLGDVFLDPMNFAFLPVKGAKGLVRSLNATANALDKVSDTGKAYQAAFSFLKSKSKIKFDKVDDFVAAATRLNLTPSNYVRKIADSIKVMQNPMQAVFKGARFGVGKTLSFADKRLINFFDYVDNYRLANPRFAEYTNEALAKLKISYKYKGLKHLFRSTFDSVKALPGRMMEKAYENIGKKQLVERTGFRLLKDYNEGLVEAVTKHTAGKTVDELDRLVMVATELPYFQTDNLANVIKRAAAGTKAKRAFIDETTYRKLLEIVNVNTPELYRSEFISRLGSAGTVGNVKGYFVDPDLMDEISKALDKFKNSLPSTAGDAVSATNRTRIYQAYMNTKDPVKKKNLLDDLVTLQYKNEAKKAAKQFSNQYEFALAQERSLLGINELKAKPAQSLMVPGRVDAASFTDDAFKRAIPSYVAQDPVDLIGATSTRQIKAKAKAFNKKTAIDIATSAKENRARVLKAIPNYADKPPVGMTKYYITTTEEATTTFLNRGFKASEGQALTLYKAVPNKNAHQQIIAIYLPDTYQLTATKGGFQFSEDIPKEFIQWVDKKLLGTSYQSDVAALWRSNKFATKSDLVDYFKNAYMGEEVTTNKAFTDFVASLPDFKAQTIQEAIANNPLKAVTQEDFLKILERPFDRANYFTDEEIKAIQELLELEWFSNLVKKGGLVRDEVVKTAEQLYGTTFAAAIPEGYARHTLTSNYRKLSARELYSDSIRSTLAGNTHVFDSREYAMSAFEANRLRLAQLEDAVRRGIYTPEQFEKLKAAGIGDMFKTELSKSLDDFITAASETASRTKMLESVITKTTLTDPELIRGIRANEKYPAGMVKVSTKDLRSKVIRLSNFTKDKEWAEEVVALLDKADVNLAIDNNLYDLIGMLGNEKEINSFVQLIDAYNNLFKGTKLLTPGFQMKNFLGNLTNILLSGVSPRKFFRESELAYRTLAQGDDLLFKVKSKGLASLTPSEAEMYKYYEGFLQSGFQDNFKSLYDLEAVDTLLKGAKKTTKGPVEQVRKILQWNSNANQAVDAQFRMNAYIYASKNPEIFMNLGLDTPQAFVRRVLFDPNDLSHYEKTVLKKLIPFYTFAKKNIVYQMQNVYARPQAYNRLRKTLDGMWELFDIDPNMDVESYKRENMWIPVFRYKNGQYLAVKANLPPSELGEFLSNPLTKTLSAASPFVRAPFELALNKQVFTGLPIQEFKGQSGYALDFMPRTAEYLVGQTGLDVPAGLLYGTGKGIVQAAKGVKTPTQGFVEGFGRSVASIGDPARKRRGDAYDTLNALKDYQKLLKQRGTTLPTIAEIENREKQSLNNTLKMQLFKYQKPKMPNYFR